MNTQIVPDQQNRTRDMGVASDFQRPPYAAALNALRALEHQFGTDDLAQAMRAMNGDREFNARRFAADPAGTRSTIALADPQLRAALERNLAAVVRDAHPYPGCDQVCKDLDQAVAR